MDNNSAEDDSQALQGLFELLLNLGNLDSDSTDQVLDGANTVLIESETIAEEKEPEESDNLINLGLDPFTVNPPNLEELVNDQNSLALNPQNQSLVQSPSEVTSPAPKSEGAIASLQSLLFGSDLQIIKGSVHQLEQKIQTLEHQIYDPQELIQLLVPVITDILGIKVSEASAEITQAIAPVIDEMITVNIGQDQVQMSEALAPVMSSAIAQNIVQSPGEFANVIAPEMGMAIQEQLRINKGVMIDALYPIIGNTITKYFAEAIKTINEKVENTFSKEGILRKIRAKLQGVSEAELILQESIPVKIRAIFLVHKTSGLIISEIQNPESSEILESDMVAGMLTAIRSFVNDCIAQSGFDAELSEIDYGGSKIMLEAAGYCYMAVVVDGMTTPILINKIRKTLEAIVETHSKAIENFNGDLDTVPIEIKPALAQIFTDSQALPPKAKSHSLLILVLVIVGAIAIPWGLIHHRQQQEAQMQELVRQGLSTNPELSVYGLTVNINPNQEIQLTGRVPNSYLRDLAAKTALAAIPSPFNKDSVNKPVKISNKIIAVNIPPDPILTKAEVQRTTALLNQLDGIKIKAESTMGKVMISGTVNNPSDSKTVSAAFAQIPGVVIINSTIQVQPPSITTRIYFEFDDVEVAKTEIPKILQIKSVMDKYPSYELKIIGHSDRLGNPETNRRIALTRAQVVRDLLVNTGISPIRLQAVGSAESGQSTPELSRYVEFELSMANSKYSILRKRIIQ